MDNRTRAQIEETTKAILEIGEGIEQALIALDRLSSRVNLPYQGAFLGSHLAMAQRMITELGQLYIPYAAENVKKSLSSDK